MIHRNYFIGLIALVTTALASLCSCFPEDNHGFPKKINFSSDGGSQIIKGDGTGDLYSFTIFEEKDLDNYKEFFNMEMDSLTYEWLTFRPGPSVYKEVELTAIPNETHKNRSMTLLLSFGNSRGTLKVTQKGR